MVFAPALLPRGTRLTEAREQNRSWLRLSDVRRSTQYPVPVQRVHRQLVGLVNNFRNRWELGAIAQRHVDPVSEKRPERLRKCWLR